MTSSAIAPPYDAIPSHVATVEAALLGLLALLLGFAFAMAMNRFETRRQVVLTEINDLSTTYLRSHLLPARQRAECQRLLEEYVQRRMDALRAGSDFDRVRLAQEATCQLQIQLWAQAVAAARENDSEVSTK